MSIKLYDTEATSEKDTILQRVFISCVTSNVNDPKVFQDQ